ncbi:hypothetical protein SAMN05421821_105170 [Mucilaginibacter lappiensis]|uniref:Uncharacterized protein n=1 Tax=Mucilaginibacter lappiensis TaxID=354630 RepID=A0ABR6PJ13_9SPHI|nr:hypothetical protein [Mucilaginibacter lappiensis]MBB6109752.1 hypothetical protein [Mucilaginibacter lappiensis]SIR14313.1 hypothetical protein SAMN05421821_105170 [Mucilaginibacter lappiensis]
MKEPFDEIELDRRNQLFNALIFILRKQHYPEITDNFIAIEGEPGRQGNEHATIFFNPEISDDHRKEIQKIYRSVYNY